MENFLPDSLPEIVLSSSVSTISKQISRLYKPIENDNLLSGELFVSQ